MFQNQRARNRTLLGLIPFISVLITALSGLYSSKPWYPEVFKYAPDSVGYSLLILIPAYVYYTKLKYCFATRAAVVVLAIMNALSLFCKVFEDATGYYIYNPLYDLAIIILLILLIIITLFLR